MVKKKISFDIDTDDFEKIKTIVKKHKIGQGDFLRQAVKEFIKRYDNNIVKLYIVDNVGVLKKTAIDLDNYKIEKDESCLSKDIISDFGFIESGYLIRDNERIRFYSRMKLSTK